MAKKLLEKNLPLEEIIEVTELTKEEIEKIKNNKQQHQKYRNKATKICTFRELSKNAENCDEKFFTKSKKHVNIVIDFKSNTRKCFLI